MDANRTKKINGSKIEEFYWAGKMVVYINNRKFDGSFDKAIESVTER